MGWVQSSLGTSRFSSSKDMSRPAKALAATVSGLASHTLPGPERPGKLRLMALTVTWSGRWETPGTRVDAGAAAGPEDPGPGLLEGLDPALLLGVAAHVVAAELDEELDVQGHLAALVQGPAHHLVDPLDVLALAAGAAAGVGEVHDHRLPPGAERATPFPGSPGLGHHGPRTAQSTSRVWA